MTIPDTRHSFAALGSKAPGCNDPHPENPMSFLRALLPWLCPRPDPDPDPFDRDLRAAEYARPAHAPSPFRNRRSPPAA